MRSIRLNAGQCRLYLRCREKAVAVRPGTRAAGRVIANDRGRCAIAARSGPRTDPVPLAAVPTAPSPSTSRDTGHERSASSASRTCAWSGACDADRPSAELHYLGARRAAEVHVIEARTADRRAACARANCLAAPPGRRRRGAGTRRARAVPAVRSAGRLPRAMPPLRFARSSRSQRVFTNSHAGWLGMRRRLPATPTTSNRVRASSRRSATKMDRKPRQRNPV